MRELFADATADVDFDAPDRAPDRFWSRVPADEAPDYAEVYEPAGKRDYRALQLQKMAIAEGFRCLGDEKRANALCNCGHTLRVQEYEHGRTYIIVNECGDLVCPTHEIARARRHFASLTRRIERYLSENPGQRGLMVTLTMKNCPSHELRSAVGKLIKACGELMGRKAVREAVHAWVRVIELTRNAQTGEWHVHAHCLWFVGAVYFRTNSPTYITQEKLRILWRRQLKADYDPIVDIRPLRGVRSPLGPEGRKSLAEILKYVLKPGSLVRRRGDHYELVGANTFELYDAGDGEGLRPMTCVPLRAVTDALRSRRLVATSSALQGDDLDFGDDLQGETADLGRYICTRVYVWRLRGRTGHYFLADTVFDEPVAGRPAMGP